MIHHNNGLLSRFIDDGLALEVTRRGGSQVKSARTVRNTANGLFRALLKSLRCQCRSSHRIGLHLLRSTGSDEDMEPNGYDVLFNMVFCTVHDHHILEWQSLKIRWKEVNSASGQSLSMGVSRLVESLALEDEATLEQKSNPSLGAGLGQSWPKFRHSPSPSSPKPVAATPVPARPESNTRLANGDAIQPTLPYVTDLCASIQRNRLMAQRLFGFIPSAETPKGFDLSRHGSRSQSSRTTILTLRQALHGKGPGLEEFDLIERINIALDLAFGVLQLCNTPWLGNVITLDDVRFLRPANVSNGPTQNPDCPHPFLVRPPWAMSNTRRGLRPVNFALLSLGILMTHIIMGHNVDSIDLREDMKKTSLDSAKNLAYEYVATSDYASDNYKRAVQWCFLNCFNFATLEDDQLSRDFHDEVIARLERDLRHIRSDGDRGRRRRVRR